MANARSSFSVSVAVLFALVATFPAAAEVNEKEPETVKGCFCKYDSGSGRITPRPFVKTAEKEYGSEDGRPEIWGYFVDRLGEYERRPDKDGKIRPVNVIAEYFVPADGKFHPVPTGSGERQFRCKLWDNATVTASK